MKPLEPPDSHHLSSAHGWIELDCPAEASAEVVKISAESQERPDVLEVRWQICIRKQEWASSLEMAERLLKIAPGHPAGWICRAYTLRRISGGGLEAAQSCLLEGHARCPQEPVIAFNLACYAAQLGDLPGARGWLAKACVLGHAPAIKKMALNDPDLEALWPELSSG